MLRYSYILLFATAILFTACSSDSTLSEEKVVNLNQPMVFGTMTEATETESKVTRGSNLEDTYTDFKVGVWKSFGTGAQQNVMDSYKVVHDGNPATDSKYTYNWTYENVLDGQILRYWDLGAFPYEFRAVAPYMADATISTAGLTINTSSKPFKAQQLINSTYNLTDRESEPCVIAHISRTKDETGYTDTDVIKDKEINFAAGKADATRAVHVPFHHLISKVGFRIYIDNPQPVRPDWQNDYGVWIDKITITVEKEGFITESQTYSASNDTGLLNGTFGGNTTTDVYTLLSHNEYKNTGQNLHNHLSRATAFDLTPNFLQQIPQDNVKIRVKMEIHTNHVENDQQKFEYDSILSLENQNETDIEGDQFTWKPNTRYIYYLHIPNLHGHKIYLNTCEILPWDDVQTSDIQIEL